MADQGVNKIILMGALGRDPESKSFPSGGKVVNFSIATSEKWKDKSSGEKKEKTTWHRICIFNEALGNIAEQYLRKGSVVHLVGTIQSRTYTDRDGREREITEIVLPRFGGELTIVSTKKDEGGSQRSRASSGDGRSGYSTGGGDSYTDDIPFAPEWR